VNFSAKLVNTLDPTHAMASLPVAVDITDVTGHTLYVTSSATTDAMGNIGTTLGPLSLAQGEYAVTASYTGQTGVFGPSGCSVTFWVANFQYNFVDMNPANGAGHYRVRLDPADKLFLFEVCDPSGGMVFPNPHDPCPAPPAQQQSFFVAATPQQFNHVTSNTPSPQSPPTDNMDYINYQSAGNGPTQFSLTGAFDEATHSFTADATYNGTRAVAMRADCSDSVLPGGTANYCSN
jgi:hypothetical protein